MINLSEQEWLEIFAYNLREIMIQRGLTQEQLARLAGVSQSSISMYLNGNKMPGIRAVINLAWELDQNLEDFILFGDRID